MAWNYVVTSSLGALTQAQREENATNFCSYFASSMTLEAICGILGNIDVESQLNPGQQEYGYDGRLDHGYGFIQWTPGSILVNWATSNGYDWYDGSAQCKYIDEENYNVVSGVVWIPVQPTYPYTWDEFKQLTSVEIATKAYLYERERPGAVAESQRLDAAQRWYEYFRNKLYVPRLSELTPTNMHTSEWYNGSGNWFAANGYGLPNCTCYCLGRWAEINNGFLNTSLRNAKWWWSEMTTNPTQFPYTYGSTPALGAIVCYAPHNMQSDWKGHVAIVEEIHEDGSITTSNSGSPSPYFWTANVSPAKGYLQDWMTGSRNYYCQGFIYFPGGFTPVPPEPTPAFERKTPFWIYLRRHR